MATRATVLRGVFTKITVGTYKVLGAVQASIAGITNQMLDASEFGDLLDVFEFGTQNGGTVQIGECLADPTDSTGQALLDSALLNQSKFGSGDLRFYVNSTSYRTIASGGYLLAESGGGLNIDRNGLAKCPGWTFKASGGTMVLV